MASKDVRRWVKGLLLYGCHAPSEADLDCCDRANYVSWMNGDTLGRRKLTKSGLSRLSTCIDRSNLNNIQDERGKRVLSNEAAKIHICSEVCGTTSGIWLLIGRHIRQEVDLLILHFVAPAWEDHGWDGW